MAQHTPLTVVSTSLAETPQGGFDVQVLGYGKLTINCIRAAIQRDNPDAEFLPTKVIGETGQTVWEFDKGDGFQRAYLREVDTGNNVVEPIIIVVDIKKRMLRNVLPVSDLPRMARAVSNGRVVYAGGRSIKERLAIKLSLTVEEFPVLGGKLAKLELDLTQAEEMLKTVIERQLKAEREAAKAERKAREQAERDAAAERTAQRRKAIMSRTQVTVYSEAGKPLHGTPVAGDEWMSLPDNHAVILCDMVDIDEGYFSSAIHTVNPKQFFFVEKRSSRVGKRGLIESVTEHRPMIAGEKLVELGDELLFQVGEGAKIEYVSAYCVSSKDDVHALRANSKLNGGALVAVPCKEKEGHFVLFSFSSGKEPKPLEGTAKPLSA